MTTKNITKVNLSQDGVENYIVGMTKEQAIRTLKLNKVDDIRIMQEDDEMFIGTTDFLIDRISLFIENDIVIKAIRG